MFLKHSTSTDFKKVNGLTQPKSLPLCQWVVEKYSNLTDMPEIHKDRQHRGGEREIHINSGRDDKREEGAREKTRRDGERRGREKGAEGGGERHRFSHVQTEGFEAFDRDPQTRVHLTEQVRLVFQAVSLPRVRRPRGSNSLLPSLHNDIRTWENNCIRADYL